METIKVMVNGLPGNMSTKAAEHVLQDSSLKLIPYSLTGPEIEATETQIGSDTVRLIKPDERQEMMESVKKAEGMAICVDYTHPDSVNDNAVFYCENGLPFVMGTTGGDRTRLVEAVQKSDIAAVIAPNMAKQIVAFQAMMEYAAETFPDVFNGYGLEVKESHQQGKADTSGTAKAMIGYFNRLGVPFTKDQIRMEREPEVQRSEWGIPEAYLSGHGWHTYSLRSEDGTVFFQFTHNVNGRDIYARGTLDAIHYLAKKIDQGAKGRVFTMIDVLKGV
ncbi:MAG: dihydrodipicolinate reductase [Desulfobacterales bacterium C00003060]|nr:MAG: dihydrodipicolinate reductase [Desulfobacterales bacterium S3730MH5]OEU77301.1 MAG: dihydrodipicolinate reductase [Desulfobacterales bacterium C00003060]OEU80075.1 MAG: dihydrodipicolinate reductase [Desulfobacterales bacterium S5133MH4]